MSDIFTSTTIEMSKKKIVWVVLLAGMFLITLFLVVALFVFLSFDEDGESSKNSEKVLIAMLIIGLIYVQYLILKKLKQ